MSRVFWDTNLFIYLLEGRGPLCDRVVSVRERMLERGDELYTSALTVGEILVKPFAESEEDLAAQYRDAISRAAVIVSFSGEAALAYARIRTDPGIRAPDAIQLACAASVGVDLFITNDDRLSRKTVDGISFVASLERAFL